MCLFKRGSVSQKVYFVKAFIYIHILRARLISEPGNYKFILLYGYQNFE